jgi:hypothetical protein
MDGSKTGIKVDGLSILKQQGAALLGPGMPTKRNAERLLGGICFHAAKLRPARDLHREVAGAIGGSGLIQMDPQVAATVRVG